MIVVKHIGSTGEKIKVDYPRKWGKLPVNLDSDITFYEIVELEKPDYNPNQYNLKEKINLTKKKGEFLNVAEIEYVLQEKSEQEIIKIVTDYLGSYLDTQYPFDRRIKYDTEGTGLAVKQQVFKEELTPEETERLDYFERTKKWVADCRQKRKDIIAEYQETGVLPTINWDERPAK